MLCPPSVYRISFVRGTNFFNNAGTIQYLASGGQGPALGSFTAPSGSSLFMSVDSQNRWLFSAPGRYLITGLCACNGQNSPTNYAGAVFSATLLDSAGNTLGFAGTCNIYGLQYSFASVIPISVVVYITDITKTVTFNVTNNTQVANNAFNTRLQVTRLVG